MEPMVKHSRDIGWDLALIACFLSLVYAMGVVFTVITNKKVHIYKDSVTQCEYLYTAGGELSAREDGMGNHYGCYTGGE